jgi:hypothetical protein
LQQPRIDPQKLSILSKAARKRLVYSCLSKRRFTTIDKAAWALDKSNLLSPFGSKPLPDSYAFNIYSCPHCAGYHIGRKLQHTKDTAP